METHPEEHSDHIDHSPAFEAADIATPELNQGESFESDLSALLHEADLFEGRLADPSKDADRLGLGMSAGPTVAAYTEQASAIRDRIGRVTTALKQMIGAATVSAMTLTTPAASAGEAAPEGYTREPVTATVSHDGMQAETEVIATQSVPELTEEIQEIPNYRPTAGGTTEEEPQTAESTAENKAAYGLGQGDENEMESQDLERMREKTTRQEVAAAAEQEAVAERLKQGFASESELAEFFRDLSEESPVEHMILYGVDDTGKLRVIGYERGESGMVSGSVKMAEVLNDPSSAYISRIRELMILHTHPQKTITEIRKKIGFEEKSENRSAFPFSGADLRGAQGVAYNDRYSKEHDTGIPGTLPGSHRVVSAAIDPTGMWKYIPDTAAPYFENSFGEQMRHLEESERGKKFFADHPEVTREAFESLLHSLSSPDLLVCKRTVTGSDWNKFDEETRMTLIGFAFETGYGHAINPETSQYEITERQLDVASGKMTPEEFIDYYKQRGVSVTYTPLRTKTDNMGSSPGVDPTKIDETL